MNRPTFYLILALLTLCSSLAYAQNNQVTLTTYYPAPNGNFQRITTGDLILTTDSGDQDNVPGYCQTNPGKIYRDSNGSLKMCSVAAVNVPQVPTPWVGDAKTRIIKASTAYEGVDLSSISIGKKLNLSTNDKFFGFKYLSSTDRAGDSAYLGLFASNTNSGQITPKMIVTDTGNIGIGLGNSTPVTLLHIKSPTSISAPTPAVKIEGPTDGASIDLAVTGRIQTGNASGKGGVWLNRAPNNATAPSMFIGQNQSNLTVLNTSATTLNLLPTGKIGINTQTPSTTLEVNGDISATNLVTSQKIRGQFVLPSCSSINPADFENGMMCIN